MNPRKCLHTLLFASILLAGQTAFPAHAAGLIRYVKTSPSGTGTCASWANACSLQPALGLALPGDQVWVKFGTYLPGSLPSDTFTLKDGVRIYGGFAGTETALTQRNPAAHITILSGDIGTPGGPGDNVHHVVTGTGTDGTAVLDGFTITAGWCDPILGTGDSSCGAGLVDSFGSPTLTNLIFSGNVASGDGGGMYNSFSSPTLTNVTFDGNQARRGGGMFNSTSSPRLTNVTFTGNISTSGDGGGLSNDASSDPTLTNVTFVGNQAISGGGMSAYNDSSPILEGVTFTGNQANKGGGMFTGAASPMLTNVTFRGNSASTYGAGMYNYAGSNPTLTNVTFSSNAAAGSGGGMANASSSPTLTNVTFSANSAGSGGGMHNMDSNPTLTDVTFSGNQGYDGGGVFNDGSSSPTLTNVTLSGNSALDIGGAIFDNGSGSPTFTNVTVSGNSAPTAGGMYNFSGSPAIYDSIFWEDGSELFNVYASLTVVDSIVASGFKGGTNVLTTDPLLGPLADNGGPTQTMALGVGSAAIDSGGGNSTCAAADQRGVPRPQGAACDMGAFEYIASSLVLFSPAAGEQLLSRRPAFDWSDVAGATHYNLQISRNAAFSSLVANAVVTPSKYVPAADLLAKTTLYWRVRPRFGLVYGSWSQVRTFTTANPPSVPALSTPASNALVADTTPRLDWNNSSVPLGTTFGRYQLQLATDSAFSAVVLDRTTSAGALAASEYTIPDPDSLTPNTTYYWRVRAFNSSGEFSSWAVRSFREALPPPALSLPTSASTVGSLRPAFDWSDVTGAGKYKIQISKSSSFSSIVVQGTVVPSTFTPTANLPAGTTLYWRVQALGTNGPSAWSQVWQFSTP